MGGKYGLHQMGCIRYSLQDMSTSSTAQRRCIEGTYNTVNAKKVEPTEGGESTYYCGRIESTAYIGW